MNVNNSNKKIKSDSNYKHQAPSWFMFFFGGIIGFFVAMLLQHTPFSIDIPVKKTVKIDQSSLVKPLPPVFDFYRLLPESTNKVKHISELSPPKKSKIIKKEVEKTKRYILQIGSFKYEKDALNLKANMVLLGLPTLVKKVIIGDQYVWFRVQVGPFSNMRKINAVRKELLQKKIESLLLKIK